MHSCKLLLDPMVVANAVRRYEQCWLPLVAAHAATRARSVLAPPLDVAWVWLLHVLDPVNYAEVKRFFSRLVCYPELGKYDRDIAATWECSVLAPPLDVAWAAARARPVTYAEVGAI